MPFSTDNKKELWEPCRWVGSAAGKVFGQCAIYNSAIVGGGSCHGKKAILSVRPELRRIKWKIGRLTVGISFDLGQAFIDRNWNAIIAKGDCPS